MSARAKSVAINMGQFSPSFQCKVVIPDQDPGLESSLGNKLQALLLFALVLVSAVAQPAFAQAVPDQVLFGPKQYLRTNGAPNQYTDIFSVPPSVGAPFLLRIVNGQANGSNRLSSASVTVNGVQVAGRADFDQDVALIRRPVSLGPKNKLEVRLASKPGGYLTVSMLGTLLPGPTSLSPTPLLLAPGASGNLSATLAPAPTSAGTLALTSANAGIASVPASVAFGVGQTAVAIPVTGVGAGSTTVTASANGRSANATINVNAPPAVTLAANPATAVAPATVTLTAIAADPDGTVAKVEFFQGASLIVSITSVPYAFTVNNLAVGSYNFTARATDNLGAATTSAAVTVTVSPNQPPSVTLAANPTAATAPASATLTATAADPDGAVAKVEFFQGATLIATLARAPYTVTVNNLAAGAYRFTAVATDNLGATMTSAAATVAVNQPPTVSITAPANNATFVAPATINITASARDTDGAVAKVEIFAGANLIATLTSAPYTFSLTNVAAGTYSLSARATDNLGAVTTSAATTIIVGALPTISLVANPTNAVAPASIALRATANDADGTITKVEFFQGATLIATVNTPGPYTLTVNSLGAGSYSFTARATDNTGLTATSAAATVTVTAGSTAATIYYIYTDQLNTPRAITNEATTMVWKWDNADPFGANAPNEDPDGDGTRFVFNLRFPGQYFDRETNTHYNYYRDYDPSIGRYVQSDPIGLQGGINSYAYVYDNPIKFTDPKGLDTYICTRPLRWNTPFGTIGINVGPFHHQYVCTVSDLNGQVICGSITASGSIFGSPASPTGPNNNDVYDPTRCQFVAPPNACLENCIASKLRGDLPIYDVRAGTRFGNSGAQQCQTFTNNVFGSCEQQCGLR